MKTFYIFEVQVTSDPQDEKPNAEPFRTNYLPELALQAVVRGTLKFARKQIDALPDSSYVLLEDSSGLITKSTETITKTSVKFDAPRKKTRKAPVEPKVAKPRKGSKKPQPPATQETTV